MSFIKYQLVEKWLAIELEVYSPCKTLILIPLYNVADGILFVDKNIFPITLQKLQVFIVLQITFGDLEVQLGFYL